MSQQVGTVEATDHCLRWTVDQFCSLENVRYESPLVAYGWLRLYLWPYGRDSNCEGYVSVGLRLSYPCRFVWQASVIDFDAMFHSHQHVISAPEKLAVATRLIQRAEVARFYGRLRMHFKFWEEGSAEPDCCSHMTYVLSQQYQPLRPFAPPVRKTLRTSTTDDSQFSANDALSLSFKRWHQDRLYANVTVKIKDQLFKIHKLVFASRSRVFDTMFRQNMSGTNTGWLTLSDITPDVFTALDEYMYTGRVANLENFAPDLLNVAEKYELPDLKTTCESQLLKSISRDTVFEILPLAELNSSSELKIAALNFLRRHGQAVTAWEGWMSFVTDHPKLVTEIFRYLLPTKNTK